MVASPWKLADLAVRGEKTRMGKAYRHPALKQLKDQQTRYAPRDRRLEQVEKAELLLGEIEGAKRYPYEYLCYRITGFRPDWWRHGS